MMRAVVQHQPLRRPSGTMLVNKTAPRRQAGKRGRGNACPPWEAKPVPLEQAEYVLASVADSWREQLRTRLPTHFSAHPKPSGFPAAVALIHDAAGVLFGKECLMVYKFRTAQERRKTIQDLDLQYRNGEKLYQQHSKSCSFLNGKWLDGDYLP